MVKNLPAKQEEQVQSVGQEDPLEKDLATHSSILAWRNPRIKKKKKKKGKKQTNKQKAKNKQTKKTKKKNNKKKEVHG